MGDQPYTTDRAAAEQAFAREAKIGLSVVAVLFLIFLYVAISKLSGWHRPRPLEPINLAQAEQQTNDSQTDSIASKPLRPYEPANVRDSEPDPEAVRTPPQQETRPAIVRSPLVARSSARANRAEVELSEKKPRSEPNSISSDFREKQSDRIVETTQPQSGKPRGDLTNTLREPPTRGGEFVPPLKPQSTELPARTIEVDRLVQNNRSSIPATTRADQPGNQPGQAGVNSPFTIKQMGLTEPVGARPSATKFIKSIRGDSFWTIAQRVYGDGRYFNALFQANRSHIDNFEELPPGTPVLTPTRDQLRKRFPRLCPDDRPAPENARRDAGVREAASNEFEYETKPNQTLFDIARTQLGQASRYLEILELNRDRLPADTDHLTPLDGGLIIRMPR